LVNRLIKKEWIKMVSVLDMRKGVTRVPAEGSLRILQSIIEGKKYRLPANAVMKNLSSGGLCVIALGELKKGTVIETEIEIERGCLDRFRAFCRVVWVKSLGNSCEAGLEFLGIKDTYVNCIKEFVKQAGS
jgi:hypothetical protein